MSFIPITVKIDIELNSTGVSSIDTPSYSSEGYFQLVVVSQILPGYRYLRRQFVAYELSGLTKCTGTVA